MNESKIQEYLIGFFPAFTNLAETGRAIMIAKRYVELGGKVVLFSHGGKYEFLAKENGFNLIKVNPIIKDEQIEEYFKLLSLEKFHSNILNENFMFEHVKEEIDAFKKTKIKLLISTNNLTCAISARAAKIPYININPVPGKFALKIPDTLENPFTFFIPQLFKVRLLNWIFFRSKMYLKEINKVAEKVKIAPFKSALDLYDGDITLVTNYLEFVNIFPNQQGFPKENYIGSCLIDEVFKKNRLNEIDSEIKKHLKKPGKSILVSLGSSGSKDLFIRIIKTLNKTNFNVIGIYTSLIEKNELPKVNNNILLKKFVTSISELTKMVDLAIIHGGQGTIFTTIYAKKPIIGYPMHIEQHINLEKIVGHGCGLMLSRKFFSKRKLLKAINKILKNYELYLSNIDNLLRKLPKPEADKIAAQRISELVINIGNY